MTRAVIYTEVSVQQTFSHVRGLVLDCKRQADSMASKQSRTLHARAIDQKVDILCWSTFTSECRYFLLYLIPAISFIFQYYFEVFFKCLADVLDYRQRLTELPGRHFDSSFIFRFFFFNNLVRENFLFIPKEGHG